MTSLEYLAGFFDADGHVRIARDRRWYKLGIGASNTEVEVLHLFVERLGGKVYGPYKNGPLAAARSIYMWQANSGVADFALELLLPHLVVKKERAELARKFWRLPAGSKERVEAFDSMRALNKRGK